MNFGVIISSLLGRSPCVKESSTRITARARIINIQRDKNKIRIGAETVIEGELAVFAHGGQIDIGSSCYVGPGTRIWSSAHVTIGNRVLIAHNVNVIDNLTHPIAPAARHRHFSCIYHTGHPTKIDLGDRPIVIDEDAWIAAGCTILRGVRIGKGAVVGAASVVTQDVPAFSLVAGNPARVVRELTAEERES